MPSVSASVRRRPWSPVRPFPRSEAWPAGVLLLEPQRILARCEGWSSEEVWRLFTDANYETRTEYVATLCGNAWSAVQNWARARAPKLVGVVVPGARRDPGNVSGALVTGAVLAALSEAPMRPRLVMVPRTELSEPTTLVALGWLVALYREQRL